MVHARGALEPQVCHVLAVADRADDGHEVALGDVGGRAHGLHAFDHGVDLSCDAPSFITIIMCPETLSKVYESGGGADAKAASGGVR